MIGMLFAASPTRQSYDCMFHFLKRKVSGAALGQELFNRLKKPHLEGHPEAAGVIPTDTVIESELVKVEWLYLQIFITDYSVFVALGKTPEKNAVMTPFWN
jgi:hypothetical protein